MYLTDLAARFHWLQMSTGLLVLLLQRTPVLRVAVQFESLLSNNIAALLRSTFIVGAMGAYNSVAGATVFNVTATPVPASPTSGPANATFTVPGTVGTAMSVGITVSGAPGSPKSYTATGPLPAGLSMVGGNPVNVTAPYKMTISGTPGAAGSSPVTIKAWDGANGTGNSAKITLTFNITGGVANIAPSFTTQPTSQSVTVGSSVSFTVTASGTPAPTYQWQKGGADIAGATNATYSIPSAAVGDAGSYAVVATNSAGSATSSAASLTVTTASSAPVITTQPVSQTVTPGSTATFTVAASGNPAPTYQWQKGGTNIAGATSATYSITNTANGDAGSYAVVVANSAGSTTSSAASLTVTSASSAPVITTQPVSQTVAPGSAATFTVAASGNPVPSYQWQKGGVNIAGATGATYSIPSTAAGDAGNYAAVVTNSAGSVTSSTATLTVSSSAMAPTITSQPVNLTVAPGGAASFSVNANGNPTPTYQWYFGGNAISGATSYTLTLSNVQAANAGNYYVSVANSAGSVISTSATLTVQSQSQVNLLTSQLAAVGHDVAIYAPGAGVTMQWQVSTDGGQTWQNLTDNSTYSGVTGNTLEVLKVSAAMNGQRYRCLVAGSASSATTLNVVQPFFSSPTGVGSDSSGNLYLSDASAQIVQKISTGGQVSLIAGASNQSGNANGTGANARFNQPGAIAVTPDGSLSVSDTANHLIRRISASGIVTNLAGTAGSSGSVDGAGEAARFSSPIGIARDASGVLFVADSMNHTIRRITVDGNVTTFAGGTSQAGATNGSATSARFNHPSGVAVDSSGNVFVADSANNMVRKITPAGVVTTLAGSAGISGTKDGNGPDARFNNPGGLAVSPSGELYLADTGNSTIRKITPTGNVTTIAGLPGISGLMDGTGGYAWFDEPEGLTVGADGNLYVADTGNAMIRKIAPTGVVTTLPLTAVSNGTVSPPIASNSPRSESGSGGGATSGWFISTFGLICLLRRYLHGC
jgi:sugar lactone lactonase YvrE